ncbi:hypothetical protein [Sphingomonas koreensis]|uniref:hypothetical protein n=1 Tax=Sphingomonas TaxID=13687 RepID=UPI003BAE410E
MTKNGGGDRKPCASPIETRAQTLVILQAQSQEEEGGAQQFERELIENAAERWVSQKAAPVHDARGWAARCHIKGTQTAKVCAPLIGDREGFPLLRWYQAIARVVPLQSCREVLLGEKLDGIAAAQAEGRIVADFTPLDVVRLVAALTQLWCMTGAARDAAEHAARRATIMRAVGRLLRV